jgi:hypothetical protein
VKKFFTFWKKITWIYVRFIQKILINVFLTVTYVSVLPFLWFFNKVFRKGKLITKFKISESYWKESNPLTPEIEQFLNQS